MVTRHNPRRKEYKRDSREQAEKIVTKGYPHKEYFPEFVGDSSILPTKTKHCSLIDGKCFYVTEANKSFSFNPHVLTQKLKFISHRAAAPKTKETNFRIFFSRFTCTLQHKLQIIFRETPLKRFRAKGVFHHGVLIKGR